MTREQRRESNCCFIVDDDMSALRPGLCPALPWSVRRAFTLIEVISVVAIVGVLSAIGLSGLRGVFSATRELGSARGVAALVARARVTAVQTHRLIAVEVLSGNAELRLMACAARFGQSTCADVAAEVPGSRVRLSGEYLGVALTAHPSASLVFDAAGFPCEFDVSGVCVGRSATATYTFDHPDRPGTTSVNVTVAGEARVQ